VASGRCVQAPPEQRLRPEIRRLRLNLSALFASARETVRRRWMSRAQGDLNSTHGTHGGRAKSSERRRAGRKGRRMSADVAVSWPRRLAANVATRLSGRLLVAAERSRRRPRGRTGCVVARRAVREDRPADADGALTVPFFREPGRSRAFCLPRLFRVASQIASQSI
jgi:hypothetical protein